MSGPLKIIRGHVSRWREYELQAICFIRSIITIFSQHYPTQHPLLLYNIDVGRAMENSLHLTCDLLLLLQACGFHSKFKSLLFDVNAFAEGMTDPLPLLPRLSPSACVDTDRRSSHRSKQLIR